MFRFKRKVSSTYNIIVADFKTTATKLKNKGADAEQVDLYIEKFKKLRDRISNQKDRNIDTWGARPFDELKKFIDELESTKSNTQQKKESYRSSSKQAQQGATLVTEDENWVIYKITSHDACVFYGKNSKWCITEKDAKHWDNYHGKGEFYFILHKTRDPRKDPLAKIAMYLDVKGNKQWFQADDKLLKGSFNWEEWEADKTTTTVPTDIPKFKTPKVSIWEKQKGININVSDSGLTSLDGAPKEVVGYFYCDNNKLTSLSGAPDKVGGHFDCSSNKLTSLTGAPDKVVGHFSCYNNELTSLTGAPDKVDGHFNCDNNKLESLTGAPDKVGGDFYCSYNKLESLTGAPDKVGGHFNCSGNELKSLTGAPDKVDGYFDCSYNKLESLTGAPKKVDGHFNCSDNKLESLTGAPDKVGGNFYCHGNTKQFTEAEVRAVCDVKGKVNV